MALFANPLPLEPLIDPLIDSGKRKLDAPDRSSTKRSKYVGPFVIDESDEEDQNQDPLNTGTQARKSKKASWLDDWDAAIETTETPSIVPGSPQAQQSTLASLIRNTTSPGEVPITIRKCSGASVSIPRRKVRTLQTYEQLIAGRSITLPRRATRSYYGIEIHRLMEEARICNKKRKESKAAPKVHPSVESPTEDQSRHVKTAHALWTEKYRARKFNDLIGDDRTHRSVLRWLKNWDPIVFPGLARSKKPKQTDDVEEPAHRKILLLTGPPGLGKTTLAHVCAKQAGYEVLEVNASDERSRDVVKGRIKDAVATENVKGISITAEGKQIRKPGKPVCVVIDEVDGVVGGSGGGEGGFMKALIDLVMLDQKNSKGFVADGPNSGQKKRKGDKFRLLRPLILICNDVYHPSLRPLRTSCVAEIIHVRQVPLDQVVQRMKHVFEKEGVSCDGDAVRRICEASWGLSASRDRQVKSRGISEGDIRGVLVAGEWVARKLRNGEGASLKPRLTRKWVEQHIISESSKDGSIPGLGRGGSKEIVDRVFLEGAGFAYDRVGSDSFKDPHSRGHGPTPVGVADLRRRHAISRLREMVDAAGEYDRCVTDCFLTYPTQIFQDDTLLSKPNSAYDWLHFHDSASSRIYSNQDWELNPYLSQAIIAFHHLFSSVNRSKAPERRFNKDRDEDEHPFSGPRADFAAFEAEKHNRAILTEFRSSLSAPLLRVYLSPQTIAMELVPNLMRMLAPEVKPVIVGGSGNERGVASVRKESERTLVRSAVRVMNGLSITFERTRVEVESGIHSGWVYRMEPALDSLTSFSKAQGISGTGAAAPVRYAVRQVLDQEYRKELLKRQADSKQARYGSTKTSMQKDEAAQGQAENMGKASRSAKPKRDFFGRAIVTNDTNNGDPKQGGTARQSASQTSQATRKAWVSFHEGFSNAVRKRITINELMSGL